MSIEIELKVQVPDHDATRAALMKAGAQLIGRFQETNSFFDTTDRSLMAGDQGLRLRISRDMGTGVETCILSHKGPREAGEFKRRQETEIIVAGTPAVAAFLKTLGFQQFLSFEKKRQSWRLDDCRIELDEAPYIGTFVEIEGPSAESIAAVRQKLGLSGHAGIRAGYPALLTEYLREHGIDKDVIAFPKNS